jgi:NADH-quinone oxidoreductase subunit J
MSDDGSRSRGRLVPAVAVGLLFAVMALTVFAADFGEVAAFPADASIVHNIGYALFNLGEYDLGSVPSEGFLAAFLIAAVALDVAVDGAVYLAKREKDGSIVAAVGEALTDGGREGGERE